MQFFINMHDGIHNHYSVNESEYAAEGVNWPATMAQLAARHCANGPTGNRLEINAHGLPAQIQLRPHINFQNLPQFAAAIRRVLKPGSFIEVLSCLVALFPEDAVADALAGAPPPAPPPPPPPPSSPTGGIVFRRLPPKPTFTGAEIRVQAMQAIATRKELLFPHRYTGPRTLNPGTPSYHDAANGPLFCTRLAKLTRSVVRAAMSIQYHDGENSGNRHFNSPIGHWEGHVFDFMPLGDVKYVGFDVPRSVFRTHDQHGDGPLRLA